MLCISLYLSCLTLLFSLRFPWAGQGTATKSTFAAAGRVKLTAPAQDEIIMNPFMKRPSSPQSLLLSLPSLPSKTETVAPRPYTSPQAISMSESKEIITNPLTKKSFLSTSSLLTKTRVGANTVATAAMPPSSLVTNPRSNIGKIARFTVFGERNSGTNFLEALVHKCFGLSITWDYGYKHFFGYNDYHRNDSEVWSKLVRMPAGYTYHRLSNNSDDVLFLAIVRSPLQWIGSMRSKPWHLPTKNLQNWTAFLTHEFYSLYDMHQKEWKGMEILGDRHIYQNRRYKNIFESRATKCSYLLDDLPKKVKHFLLIKYEDLIDLGKAKLVFDKIAMELWGTNFPNPEENFHLKALAANAAQAPTLYTLPDVALNIVNKQLDRTVEAKLGY